MGLTAFSRLGCVFLLLAYGVSGHRYLCADEAPITASDLKEESLGSAADQGRLTWAVLEAIEQHHIAPPPRPTLVRLLTQVLKTQVLKALKTETPADRLDEGLLERLDAKILQCESANEMADVFERMEGLTPDFKRFIDKITFAYREILSKDELIRAKEHDVEEQVQGNRYVGLGVAMRTNDPRNLPIFAHIVPGGAADRGGLKPNTVVYEIDGRPTENVPHEKILDWLRGPSGSDVTLNVSSENSNDRRQITLTRGVVRFDSLKNHKHQALTHDGLRFDQREPIGWIKVERINGSTLHEFRVAESLALKDGIRVLVLDFRGYGPHGDLHQSLLIADSFLDGGVIWTRIEGSAEPRIEFADRDCLFRDIPLVVLIDRTTRPCLSAIAAALQDAGRAKLVGVSPQFMGVISSMVRLNGVPYSVTMATESLNRTRLDRQWPLEPDYPVAENTAVPVKQTDIPKGFRMGDREILENDLYPKSSDIRKAPSSNETTTSAAPGESGHDNQKGSNASGVVIQDNPSIQLVPKQRQLNEISARPAPLKRKLPIEDVAILVALELQRGLPPKSAQAVPNARNEQNKESKR